MERREKGRGRESREERERKVGGREKEKRGREGERKGRERGERLKRGKEESKIKRE